MRRCVLILSALVAVLGALVVAKLHDSGDLDMLTPLGIGACRRLSPPPNVHAHGLEDLVRTRSGAILSGADLRSYLLRGGYNVSRALHKQGAVFSYHPSDGTLRHVAVSGYDHEHFHPHGLGLLYGRDSRKDTLFMVNHRLDPAYSVPTTLEAVELFTVHENSVTDFKLTHVETVVHPLFRALNDVVPIDEDTFYFTNWFHYRGDSNPLMKWVELLTAQPWSNIGLCTRKAGPQWQCRLVVEGLGMANGMDLSRDGKYLFVVADYTKNLLVYERQADHGLKLVEDIPLGHLCDNVVTAESGELHVACHAKALSFLFLHLSNPAKYPSPSVVLKIDFTRPGEYRSEEVLVSLGLPINAASAATVTQGQIVLGSVTQEGLTVCDGF